MPQLKYMTVSEVARFISASLKPDENIITDLLQMLDSKGSKFNENLYKNPTTKKLFTEIKYAQENNNSTLAKNFLRDTNKLLLYLNGDKKHEEILKKIDTKQTFKLVKNMHMLNADIKEAAQWILTDECDDMDTFIKIYDKTLDSSIEPEILVQWWSVPNDKNEPYTPINKKLANFYNNKLHKTEANKQVKKLDKDNISAIQKTYEAKKEKLNNKIPDNANELIANLKNAPQKTAGTIKAPGEDIEDLQKELAEAKKEIEKQKQLLALKEASLKEIDTLLKKTEKELYQAHKEVIENHLDIDSLRNKILNIKMIGKNIKEAKLAAIHIGDKRDFKNKVDTEIWIRKEREKQ